MDAVLLTYRWQNIFAIWVMVGFLYLLVTVGHQVALKYQDGAKANG
jgi:hypothetical protein